MNLEKKKNLIARTLEVGKDRIILNTTRLDEIKEIITKQDVRDLFVSGAIAVREIKGKKTIQKRKGRRRAGSIKQKVGYKKQKYVKRTRKLRAYLKSLKFKKQISNDLFLKLRREIRASVFKDLNHLKERLSQLKE